MHGPTSFEGPLDRFRKRSRRARTEDENDEKGHSWRYLRPSDLKRLRNMEFVARNVVEGYFSGKHRSPYRDFSQEFADYRAYSPGDDLRVLDWKAHARTDRYYIKLFRKDTGMLCYLFLDQSNSMAYRGTGELSKLEFACFLAAALGFLIVKQGDRIGFCLFDHHIRVYRHPGSTMPHLFSILNHLEDLQPGGTTGIAGALRQAYHQIKRRGLLIVVSDFLDDPSSIFTALSMFAHKRFEIILFHILHDDELNLPAIDHARFIDLETQASLVVESDVVRDNYVRELETYLALMRSHARARRIDYNLVTTSTHYNVVIEKYMSVRQSVIMR